MMIFRTLAAALALLPALALSLSSADFNVSNVGLSAYLINGNSNPTLTLVRGRTYTFSIAAPGHPFWIKTSGVTGTGSAFTSGVTGNGTASGTLTFNVPADAPGTLFYICQFHPGMAGTLQITNAPPPSPAVLTNAGFLPDGSFEFTVQGTAGHLHTIEVNTNNPAVTNWITLTTTNPPANTFRVVDTNAGTMKQRFYRVKE